MTFLTSSIAQTRREYPLSIPKAPGDDIARNVETRDG